MTPVLPVPAGHSSGFAKMPSSTMLTVVAFLPLGRLQMPLSEMERLTLTQRDIGCGSEMVKIEVHPSPVPE